jgi:hypothetical protein
MDLRKEAQGRECQIRIPGVCNRNRDAVVLAHLNDKRLFGVGTGQKVPDMFGAHACSACHDEVDGRTQKFAPTSPERLVGIKFMFTDGVFRTQNILRQEGKL